MKRLLLLHLLFLFFSLSGILAKYASFEELLSIKFILLYGAQLLILFVYSIFWQIILRNVPLTVAYANRGIVTIWALMWGILLFNEEISIVKIASVVIIVSGIVIIGNENE